MLPYHGLLRRIGHRVGSPENSHRRPRYTSIGAIPLLKLAGDRVSYFWGKYVLPDQLGNHTVRSEGDRLHINFWPDYQALLADPVWLGSTTRTGLPLVAPMRELRGLALLFHGRSLG